MKKFLLGAFAAVSLSVTLASCSSEEPVPAPTVPNNPTEIPSVQTDGELVAVTFDASVPKGIHSRSTSGAWPEWTAADGPLNLEVGVYASVGALSESGLSTTKTGLVLHETYENIDLSSPYSVKLNLAKEGNYSVRFIAYSTPNGTKQYDIDWENHTITNVYDLGGTYGVTPFSGVNAGKCPLFIYDEPISVKPSEQSNYSITLRRPTAEVVLLSNYMDNPTTASAYPYGVETSFGQYAYIGWPIAEYYNGYDFLNGQLVSDSRNYSRYMKVSEYTTANSNTELVFPGYPYHKVLWRGQIFVDRNNGFSQNPYLFIRPANTGDPTSARYTMKNLNGVTFERNKRYVFVDNSGSNNGDDGESGGIFTTVTSFSMDIDGNFTTSNSINL